MKRQVIDYLTDRDLAERAAAFAATATVGPSFAPGLLPRGPMDQAVATGLSASMSYGIASVSQSLIDGLAKRIAPGKGKATRGGRKYLAAVANLAAIGAGIAVQRAFVQRRGEPIKRAMVRTAGFELVTSGAIGLTITAATGAAEAAAERAGGRLHPMAMPSGLLIGGAMSALQIAWFRRHEHHVPPLAASLGQGLGVTVGVTGIALSEAAFARFVAKSIRSHVPGISLLAEPIGHAIGLGVLGAAVWSGLEYVDRMTEHGGAAIEAAYSSAPSSPSVSGGPKSQIEWTSVGREGRRFVNMALTPERIEKVMGRSGMDPVRAFVGLASDVNLDTRVAMCLRELEDLGAFERSVLCLVSPTGTGYVNYVMTETLEYLTGGDCATVAMQYSLRPSFLSLDRVRVGREQNRALLHAISGRLLGIAPERRPKFVGFGESLGAFTLQDAFLREGTSGFRRAGLSRILCVGTPAESKWAEQWRLDPERNDPGGEVVEVASYDEWLALPDDVRERARYVLLSHHEDPITKFSPDLAVQAPEWMMHGPKRSPAVPTGVEWHPFTTFFLTAVDLKNASKVVPGSFAALGHDYRADLARFTQLSFGLEATDAEISAIERALQARELRWAERRLVADQFAQAREAVSRQLKSWGATGEIIDSGSSPFAALAALSGGAGVA